MKTLHLHRFVVFSHWFIYMLLLTSILNTCGLTFCRDTLLDKHEHTNDQTAIAISTWLAPNSLNALNVGPPRLCLLKMNTTSVQVVAGVANVVFHLKIGSGGDGTWHTRSVRFSRWGGPLLRQDIQPSGDSPALADEGTDGLWLWLGFVIIRLLSRTGSSPEPASLMILMYGSRQTRLLI